MLSAVVTQSQTMIGHLDSIEEADKTQSSQVKLALVNPDSTIPTSAVLPEQPFANIKLDHAGLASLHEKLQQRIAVDSEDYEAKLLKSIITFQLGETEKAIDDLTILSEQAPHFHLAHLVRGDLMASRFRITTDIGSPGLFNQNEQNQEQLNALRHEAEMRILANINTIDTNKVPLQLLNLSNNIQTALVVDKSQHRIYVFERENVNAPARLVRDFYVSTGRKTGNKKVEGDLRTPEGVYFITSWIPDDELPEKYGIGAFPTNYPNALDRKLGKTGDGIWLHGTDRIFYSRPPLDSEGCVVLSNLDLGKIRHLIKPGQTPLIITDKIQWVDEQQWNQVRNQVISSIERWRQDWESLDVNRYLSHYADDFWSGRHNLKSWREYKSRIARHKTYQKVELNDLSLFFYPEHASNGTPMVVASFVQNYQSNNYQGEVKKRLYLGKQANNWRILYEGR